MILRKPETENEKLFDDNDCLQEHQLFDPAKNTRESILMRMISQGGEMRTVDGHNRIYVYKIVWFISGYDRDRRTLMGDPVSAADAERFENLSVPIYFDLETDSFVGPFPEAADLIELVDNTLHITDHLASLKSE